MVSLRRWALAGWGLVWTVIVGSVADFLRKASERGRAYRVESPDDFKAQS